MPMSFRPSPICRVCGGRHLTDKPCPGNAFKPAHPWTPQSLSAADAREATSIARWNEWRRQAG